MSLMNNNVPCLEIFGDFPDDVKAADPECGRNGRNGQNGNYGTFNWQSFATDSARQSSLRRTLASRRFLLSLPRTTRGGGIESIRLFGLAGEAIAISISKLFADG